MAGSISIREYIRWLPEEKEEPTTTVVLTSPERKFIDIRVLKPVEGDKVQENPGGVLPISRLDWAFAGTSETHVSDHPQNISRPKIHSKWHHWVDSRTENAESVRDEGDIDPQEDGLTMERGSMINPATGKLTDYEECWRDVQPVYAGDSDDFIADRKLKVCVAMKLHDDAQCARGVVIRVGQYVQGVLRVGESFSLERWHWDEGDGWTREVRIGNLWLPCGVPMGERMKVGMRVSYGEFVWEVVEVSEWE